MIFGLTWPDIFDSALFHPLWGGLAAFLTQLGLSSLFVFFFVFPDGRFVPRWTRWVVPLVFVMPVVVFLFPGSRFVEPPQAINVSAFVALWACCLLAQVYRYRRVSGVVQRQQTKWLDFGVAALVVLLAGFLLPLAAFPALIRPGASSLFLDLAGLTVAGSFGFLLIPLSIGMAILRYRLYDIDVIINRTLVYASLTLSLTVTYFASVAALEYAFRAFTGRGLQLAIVASTLAIAALFVPLRRRVQEFVDRRFYRQKYDAGRVLAGFSVTLRDETDLDRLSEGLLGTVRETVQPEHASLWLRTPRDAGGVR